MLLIYSIYCQAPRQTTFCFTTLRFVVQGRFNEQYGAAMNCKHMILEIVTVCRVCLSPGGQQRICRHVNAAHALGFVMLSETCVISPQSRSCHTIALKQIIIDAFYIFWCCAVPCSTFMIYSFTIENFVRPLCARHGLLTETELRRVIELSPEGINNDNDVANSAMREVRVMVILPNA